MGLCRWIPATVLSSLAAWVRDTLEHVMVVQVSYVSFPMVHLLNGALFGHSIFQPLDISKEVHIYSELLEDNNFDALHTLGVHPIRNQFRQYPLCYI
jgi:hypothetical protein